MAWRVEAVGLAASLVLAATSFAQPLSTAITYQGELLSASAPANGTFDMQFKLFDGATSTVQVGTTQCVNNIVVADGQFTAEIDFGNQYDGLTRYLEILVRTDAGSDCSTGGGYTTLSPRTKLTITPQAGFSLRSATATTSNSLGGQPASFYTNAANLSSGIIPDARLAATVARTNTTQTFSGALTFTNASNSYAGSGALLSSLNASNITTGLLADARLSTNIPRLNAANAFGNFINSFGGRVGIGVPLPSVELEVDGDSIFTGLVAVGDSPSPRRGSIRFNESLNRFEGYTGAWWVVLGSTAITPAHIQTFTVGGATSFTVPANVYSLGIDGWSGAGGGGGASSATLGSLCGSTGPSGGGGGGSGAYGFSIVPVTPGDVLTIIVGIGGNGGSLGASGVNGATTRVIRGGTIVLELGGGAGGRGGVNETIINTSAACPPGTGLATGGTGGTIVTASSGSVAGNSGLAGSAPYNLGGCGFPNFPDMRVGCGGSRGPAVSGTSPLGATNALGGLGGTAGVSGGVGSAGASGIVRIFY